MVAVGVLTCCLLMNLLMHVLSGSDQPGPAWLVGLGHQHPAFSLCRVRRCTYVQVHVCCLIIVSVI